MILFEEFNRVRQFVTPFAKRYKALNTVKTMIKQNIPPSLSAQERAAFENEIDDDTRVLGAMERFLRFVGKRTFERVFP